MMMPMHYLYQMYTCIIILTIWGGLSLLIIALMSIFGIDGLQVASMVLLGGFLILAKIFIPPWPGTPLVVSQIHHQRRVDPKHLDIDTFVLKRKNHHTDGGVDSSCSSSRCCTICLEELNADEKISKPTICQHEFHQDCLDQWLRKSPTCPYCRRDLERKGVRRWLHHTVDFAKDVVEALIPCY